MRINVQYNKLKILLEQKQQSRSKRNNDPTTFETINTFNSSRVKTPLTQHNYSGGGGADLRTIA